MKSVVKNKILDVHTVRGKNIRLSDYTHILAYHACRAEDEQIFRIQGLKPYAKEDALATAIQKLESDRVSREKIEAAFYPLWEKNQSLQPTKVWLMLETKEFMSISTHYLIYGSEFINALAMHLGCRDRLKKIGKPMIVVCTIPITDIAPCWLNDLEQDIKSKGTDNRSIAVSSVAPENIVDILYPTGYVRDPYSWQKIKIGDGID